MNEILIQKQTLRKKYLLIRNNIPDKEIKSKIIIEKIKLSKIYQESKVIALYKSLKSEVDTKELIEYSLKIGKIVVLPKVEKNELKFYKISLNEPLIKSNFGVEEPLGLNINYIDKSEIDLVIVPGLCFDKENNRLGFGKGYYDRFLSNTNLYTIALCFKEQILEDTLLPVEITDIKLKEIISDELINSKTKKLTNF